MNDVSYATSRSYDVAPETEFQLAVNPDVVMPVGEVAEGAAGTFASVVTIAGIDEGPCPAALMPRTW